MNIQTQIPDRTDTNIAWLLWDDLDSLDIGVVALTPEGEIVRCNRTAGRLIDIDPEDLRGSDGRELLSQLASTEFMSGHPEIIRDCESRVRQGVRYTNRFGVELELDLCLRPIPVESDESPLLWCLMRDNGPLNQVRTESTSLRQELRILAEVAAALSSSQELSRVLRVILTGATASQGLGFNRAFLFLNDSEQRRLRGHLAVGPRTAEEADNIWSDLDAHDFTLEQLLGGYHNDPDDIDPITSMIADFSIDLREQSLISELCSTGRGVNLEPRMSIDEVTAALADHLGTRCLAIVPMVSKDRLHGMLVADNFITGRPISDDAVHLLQILANQAAVAMERGRLYEIQKERARELERMNQLLADSQDQIIRFEKMSVIGELTSAVAHELRNPLTIVGGFANMMLKADMAEEQREYLNIISSEVRRAEGVLDHVLDFSKASASEHQQIEFSTLVERNLQLLLGRLRRAEVALSLSTAQERILINGNNDHLSHAVYQVLKVIVEELIPPCTGQLRTELHDGKACLRINLTCPDSDRPRIARSLGQIFGETRAVQHLSILVACETIKYHGGNYGRLCPEKGPLSLFIELPTIQENRE